MNIFVLHTDPVKAAKMQCDKHVVKMVLETAQLLCTAHYLSGETSPNFYKPTHKSHPCTKWAANSSSNYKWLYEHFTALCDEYAHRYGKTHLSDKKLREALQTEPVNILQSKMEQWPLAMTSSPECIKDSVVESYRAYYKTKRDKFKMVWTKRDVPSWF